MHKHKIFPMTDVKLATNTLNMPSVKGSKDVSIDFWIHQSMKKLQHYFASEAFSKAKGKRP